MKNYKYKSLIWLVLILIWVVIIVAGYYLVHKPISPMQFVSIVTAVLDISVAFGISCLGGAIGRRVLPISRLSGLLRFSLQVAIGWGILSLIWMIVGLIGFYTRWFAWGLLILGIIIFWKDLKLWLMELNELRILWEDSTNFGKLLATGCGLTVIGQLIFALAPPYKWDTLAYHLELPRQYIAAGRFLFLPDNPLWGRSQITEVLYTWAMALRGMETATTLGWFFSLAFMIGILGLVRQLSSVTAGWVAVTALMVGYTFRGLFSWGYVDGLAALFGYCVLVSLIIAIDGKDNKWFLWVGVFIGLSLGVKFTNGLLWIIAIVVMIISRKTIGSSWWKYCAGISAIAILIFLPWLLKNGMTTGNPLYPHLWETSSMSKERLLYYQGWANFSSFTLHDLFLPISLSWYGIEAAEIVGIERYYADIGPLLVLFTIPGLIYKRNNKIGQIVIIWLVVGWISMIVGGRITPLLWQSRYYFCLLPAAAIGVGWGWEAVGKISIPRIRLVRVVGVIVLLVLVLTIFRDIKDHTKHNPLGVVLGIRSNDSYLDDMLGYYAVATRSLANLPPGSRVLILWDERGLYAPLGSDADELIDRWFVARQTIGEPKNILNKWREEGFTHLLINQIGARFERENRNLLSKDDWSALDDLLIRLPTATNFGDAYQLYSLLP